MAFETPFVPRELKEDISITERTNPNLSMSKDFETIHYGLWLNRVVIEIDCNALFNTKDLFVDFRPVLAIYDS